MFLLFSPHCGAENHSFRMEGTYTRAAAVGAAPALDLKKIQIRLEEITKSEMYARKERDVMKLVPSEKTIRDKNDKTVVYRTQTVTTNRIEIISENDIEECLGSILNTVTVVDRGSKYSGGEIFHQRRGCLICHYCFA